MSSVDLVREQKEIRRQVKSGGVQVNHQKTRNNIPDAGRTYEQALWPLTIDRRTGSFLLAAILMSTPERGR